MRVAGQLFGSQPRPTHHKTAHAVHSKYVLTNTGPLEQIPDPLGIQCQTPH